MKMEQRLAGDQVRARRRRVLVVDDHAGFRTCARELLEAEGFEVVGAAGGGGTARPPAAQLHPGRGVHGRHQPHREGFEVTERLLAVTPDLDIVLVSSRDRSSYGPLVEQSGARGFVSKGDLSGESIEELLV
jgi:DNA-binding NarL/FixJ family response regulator